MKEETTRLSASLEDYLKEIYLLNLEGQEVRVTLMGLLLPMFAAAQTVKSPDGNVSLTFSLTGNGQPT